MSNHEIGGYFGLELCKGSNYPHARALHLNSARNAFMHVIQLAKPSKVYIPSYLCKSMLEPLISSGTSHDFYHIDESLEIADLKEVSENDLILYVNYFGVKNGYSTRLFKHYSQSLVIDNSQAFFSLPIPKIPCIYSPRKFVGVSDGGILYGVSTLETAFEKDSSVDTTRHLIGRHDDSAANFYHDYRRSEELLAKRPLRAMSKFTRSMLQSIDYNNIKLKRERNFWYLHTHLASINQLSIVPLEVCGPMAYPLWTSRTNLREILKSNRIYIAKYWSEVLENPYCSEVDKQLTNELLPIPIDQRYTINDMNRIIEVILQG